MYKKIKNSSFMNLIWFILCIIPILIVFIYSLSFLNKEPKTIIEYETRTATNLLSDKTTTYTTEYITLNTTNNALLYETENWGEFGILSLNNTILEGNYYLYLILENNIEQGFYEMDINDTPTQNFLINEKFAKFEITLEKNTNIQFVILEEERFQNNNICAYFITNINYNWTYEDFITNNNYYEIQYQVPIEKTIYNSLNDYLLEINNSIETNGFISNAFLNLAQLFGVTNVYYSLACYYIEYLLVIVLLHLAFDILYMLPNICHKFMEKLGGERD